MGKVDFYQEDDRFLSGEHTHKMKKALRCLLIRIRKTVAALTMKNSYNCTEKIVSPILL